jgi:hypothetical protein
MSPADIPIYFIVGLIVLFDTCTLSYRKIIQYILVPDEDDQDR